MVKRKSLKLKPSARDKRRYFLVKASGARVKSVLLEYLGILGLARAAYVPVKVDGSKVGYFVGSCLVGSLNDVRASLGLAGIRIEKVSGTIKGLGD